LASRHAWASGSLRQSGVVTTLSHGAGAAGWVNLPSTSPRWSPLAANQCWNNWAVIKESESARRRRYITRASFNTSAKANSTINHRHNTVSATNNNHNNTTSASNQLAA